MTVVDVDGRQLKVSNLDKVLYRSAGFTKGQVIDYYARVAETALPHWEGRCMTLKRYPNGPDGQFFYEKNCPKHRPAWVTTAPVYSAASKRTIDYCVVDSMATTVWVANLAALELHPSLSRSEKLDQPTMVVFDLDPGPPAAIAECCQVALSLREVFGHLGLESFAKTSGSKGMQIYVPLNTPSTYDGDGGTKAFALAIAQLLERQSPDLVLSDMNKDKRKSKVFVDWSQNDEHKTTIGVYSLRARERPWISTPVTWDEVGAAASSDDELRFEAEDVLRRIDEQGDLFAPTAELRQELPRVG